MIFNDKFVRLPREIFSEIGKCVAFKIFHRRIPCGRTGKAKAFTFLEKGNTSYLKYFEKEFPSCGRNGS